MIGVVVSVMIYAHTGMNIHAAISLNYLIAYAGKIIHRIQQITNYY